MLSYYLFQDIVISSCEWLSEFLHADHSVLKGIKGVVNAGHVERLENELDIERLAQLVLLP